MMSAHIRQYALRLARLLDERDALSADIAELKKQAKGEGIDVKALVAVVKEARMDAAARSKSARHEAVVELYRAALGQLADTPLDEAALQSAA